MKAINEGIFERHHGKRNLSLLVAALMGVASVPLLASIIPAAWFFVTTPLDIPDSQVGKTFSIGAFYVIMFLMGFATCALFWWLGTLVPLGQTQ
jgi:hypothetical protein